MRTSRRTRWLRAAATALLVATSGLAGLASAQPASAAGCTLRYRVNLWPVDANDRSTYVWNEEGELVPTGEIAVGTAFTVDFHLTNGGAAVNPWQASWYAPGGLRLVGAKVWGATTAGTVVTSRLSRVTVRPVEWNPLLPSGGSVSFGAQAIVPGTATAEQAVRSFRLGTSVCTLVFA